MVQAVHLRALRLAAGMTQEDLAVACGMKTMMISHFEQSRREMSMRSAWRIADALGVSIDTLIDRVPAEGPCTGFTPFDLRPVPVDLRTARRPRQRRLTLPEAERLAKRLAADGDPLIEQGVLPERHRV